MKRILAIVAALGLSLTAFADEGMWLLPLLQKMNGKALKEAGCKLTPEEIYSINHSSLKDAIIHFGGGCTGEIISSEGLIVTNHHCGYSSIQALSTDEHNYLMDGYWAMTRMSPPSWRRPRRRSARTRRTSGKSRSSWRPSARPLWRRPRRTTRTAAPS